MHLPQLHLSTLFDSTEVNEVYAANSLLSFAMALIGVFVPIYLFNLGYSLQSIGLLLAGVHFSRMATVAAAGYLIDRFGAKHVMAMSQIFSMLFVVFLATFNNSTLLLIAAGVAYGIHGGLYLTAYHYNLSAIREKEETSREISVLMILSSISKALGPLIGGVIATQFGFRYTLIFVGAFLLLSGYSITRTQEKSPAVDFTWKKVFSEWESTYKSTVANFVGGVQGKTGSATWPLFIFLFLGSYQSVGLVTTISLIAGIIVTYTAGARGDHGKNQQQIRFGSWVSAAIHMSRPIAQNFLGATIINVVSNLAGKLYKVPFLSYYYQNADSAKDRLGFVMKMEIAHSFGSLVGWLSIAILAFMLPIQTALTVGFFLAALAISFKPIIAETSQ